MRMIEGQTFDMERALYGSRSIHLKDCAFDGPADGESVAEGEQRYRGRAYILQSEVSILA